MLDSSSYDASTQARFARSCSDAAFGYANAATAACASMTTQAFDMWATALRSAMPPPARPEPRSWYRHPDERVAPPVPSVFTAFVNPYNPFFAGALASPQPFTAWMRPWSATPAAASPQNAVVAMMSPWTTWMSMWSGPRVATAWPMAVVMVSGGVPHAVAVPAAEAHAAVLDAATIAADHLAKIYSAYRSEGGHASTQIVAGPRRSAASTSRHPASATSLRPRRTEPAPQAMPTVRPPMPAMWPWLH